MVSFWLLLKVLEFSIALAIPRLRSFRIFRQFFATERPMRMDHVTGPAELVAPFVFNSISSTSSLTVTCLSGLIRAGCRCLPILDSSFRRVFFEYLNQCVHCNCYFCWFQSAVFAECRYLYHNAKLLQSNRIPGFPGDTANPVMDQHRWVGFFLINFCCLYIPVRFGFLRGWFKNSKTSCLIRF